jgi:hypothetical protein
MSCSSRQTIKPISNAGFPFHTGSQYLSLSFQEILGLLVVCVNHDLKIEAQPELDVFGPGGSQVSLGRILDLVSRQIGLDSLLEFVFSQLGRGGNSDRFGKILKLSHVPIPVVELNQCHGLGQFVRDFKIDLPASSRGRIADLRNCLSLDTVAFDGRQSCEL